MMCALKNSACAALFWWWSKQPTTHLAAAGGALLLLQYNSEPRSEDQVVVEVGSPPILLTQNRTPRLLPNPQLVGTRGALVSRLKLGF